MTSSRTKISFTSLAWEEYLFWQQQDKKTLKKINSLFKEIIVTPFEGNGKPEPLKHNLAGFWSRRIDDKNRIIYAVDNETILIVRVKGHYEKD